jgi:hypothetical protein
MGADDAAERGALQPRDHRITTARGQRGGHARSSALRSSSSSVIAAARTLDSMLDTLLAPGIGRSEGERPRSHASAISCGLAPCLLARRSSVGS